MELPVNYNELSVSERRAVREEYVRLQNGLCAYYGCSLLHHSVACSILSSCTYKRTKGEEDDKQVSID